jgi:Flp pilus assembly protein TadG
MLNLPRKSIRPKRNQQGIVMVVVAIAAFVIIAMAGLALDFGHVATNRARLQNSLDAAALGAARALIVTSSQAQADAAGRLIFKENIEAVENADLIAGGADENNLAIEFSNTLKPFVVDATASSFVRVRMNGSLTYATWFMSVLGTTSLDFNSSAVAGASPSQNESCDMAPFVVCGDPDDEDNNFGYPEGTIVTVKLDSNDSDIGVGNFQLARIDEDDAGGADIRENLAGGATACVSDGDTLDTEPGNTIGPVAQGMNTRFGVYQTTAI